MSTLSNICLEAFNIDFTIVRVWLMFVYIISIMPCKLIQYIFLMLSSHFFFIISFFNFIIYFALQVVFHIFWHFILIFEFLHPVDVIVFLVKLKWIEPMLSLLLVVYLLSCLLLSYLLLCLLQFLIDRF